MKRVTKRSSNFNLHLFDMNKGDVLKTSDIMNYPPQIRGTIIQNPFVNITIEGDVTGFEPYTATTVPMLAGDKAPNNIPQGVWLLWCNTITCKYACITSLTNSPFTSAGFSVSAGASKDVTVPVGKQWYITLLKGSLTMNSVQHTALKELALVGGQSYSFIADTDVVLALIKMD